MGRITLNNSMAQFSCKLSCNPKLWNSRSGWLEGKSKEAVETNTKIERILLSVNSAIDNLVKDMAGCTQPISHHMGRHYYASILTLSNDVPIDVISKMLGHTNATLLVSAGMNMESVSKMMGHSSIKSTQKYAQITVNRISQEMDRLKERRKEKEQQTSESLK